MALPPGERSSCCQKHNNTKIGPINLPEAFGFVLSASFASGPGTLAEPTEPKSDFDREADLVQKMLLKKYLAFFIHSIDAVDKG